MNANECAKYHTITETANKVGVSVTTLRRWEWMNRIKPARLANGIRIYSEQQIEELRSLKEETR